MVNKECFNCFYRDVDSVKSPCVTCYDSKTSTAFSNWIDRSIYIKEVEEEDMEVTNEEEDVFKQMTDWLTMQYNKEQSDKQYASKKELGVKFDSNKPQWSLLPFEALEEVVEVLTSGAQKYAPDNWKYVPNADARYMDAAFRHMAQYMQGEQHDEETGNNHLAHAVCCLLFKLWFDRQQEKEELYNDSF
jgi:hypothetical protein